MRNYLEFKRNRRFRSSSTLRSFVRETELLAKDLIYPLFVVEGSDEKREVPSMPGIFQLPLNELETEIKEICKLGIQSIIIFGIPEQKDDVGSGAYDASGIVQRAIRKIKQINPNMLIIADTCLCEYTSHGHCGVIENDDVDNDQSIKLIAQTAVSQAEAGADMIAPSSMLDGDVAAIRKALNEAHFQHIPIMSYAVKYASSFYGPFRDAAESTPQFGDRKTYQMDPANRVEAIREVEADIKEGADMLIVKPALSYLDVVYDISEAYHLPIVAYNVSGEYAMVKAAAIKQWISEEEVVFEKLLSMKRAGAQRIISYYAKEVASWLKNIKR